MKILLAVDGSPHSEVAVDEVSRPITQVTRVSTAPSFTHICTAL